MKENKNLKKPFFANFLENQLSNEETSIVQGGITNKLSDNVQTMKYPSDSEEGPGDTTKPTLDLLQTMKYPSDNDEAWPAE
jgi:hypothetical protein